MLPESREDLPWIVNKNWSLVREMLGNFFYPNERQPRFGPISQYDRTWLQKVKVSMEYFKINLGNMKC